MSGTLAATGSVGSPVTQWSFINEAQGNGERAAWAMNELCALYWPPAYAFVRRPDPKSLLR